MDNRQGGYEADTMGSRQNIDGPTIGSEYEENQENLQNNKKGRKQKNSIREEKKFDEKGTSGIFLWVGRFLDTNEIDDSCQPDSTRRIVRDLAPNFVLRDGGLFLKPSDSYPIHRRFVGDYEDRIRLIISAHEGLIGGHHGTEQTRFKVSSQYYWPGLGKDVAEYVVGCRECQEEQRRRPRRPMIATFPPTTMSKVHIDIVKMPQGKDGKTMFIEIRDDLSGFVFARSIRRNDSRTVTRVLSDFVTIFGTAGVFVADHGEVDTVEVRSYLSRTGIDVVFSSAYHPQGNAKVERGHQSLVKTLETICGNRTRLWPEILPLAVLADNSSVRRNTGVTPFELMFGRPNSFAFGEGLPTWPELDARLPISRHELLCIRFDQLAMAGNLGIEAQKKLYEHRRKSIEFKNRTVPETDLEEGDQVYLLDSSKTILGWRKLTKRWLGPYLVAEDFGNGSYRLAEFDGTVLKYSAHGSRLKKVKRRPAGVQDMVDRIRKA